MVRWGVDLGGTKIEAIALDGERVLARRRISTEAHQGYDHIIAQIGRVIDLVAAEAGPRPERIGIGTPGVSDPTTGLMKNCNTTCLNGRPLPDDLKERLGGEFVVANDANCFALAEATLGAARGESVVFGVILGTGVGGGVVVDGRALYGRHGIAGEWGHNELEPNGERCYCGKTGCVETVISGPALERFYARRSGRTAALREIATESDEASRETIGRLCEEFGRGLAPIVNVLDPDAIVLGGGVGNIDALYTRGRDELARRIFNPTLATRILRPSLGDSAGVFGAAALTSVETG